MTDWDRVVALKIPLSVFRVLLRVCYRRAEIAGFIPFDDVVAAIMTGSQLLSNLRLLLSRQSGFAPGSNLVLRQVF